MLKCLRNNWQSNLKMDIEHNCELVSQNRVLRFGDQNREQLKKRKTKPRVTNRSLDRVGFIQNLLYPIQLGKIFTN